MAYTTYHKTSTGRVIQTHFQDYDKYKAFRNKKSGQLVDKAKYESFQQDTEAKQAANVAAAEKQDVMQSRLGYEGAASGREEQETAYNIAQTAQGGGSLGRESSITQGQADAAMSQLGTLSTEDRAAQANLTDKYSAENAAASAQNKEEYAQGIAAAQKAGMTVKGLPVKLNPSTGKLQYDLQKIGTSMGMSADAIKEAAGVKFGQRTTDAAGRIQDMVGGTQGSNQSQVSNDWNKQAGSLSDTGAMINNLSVLDPLVAKVDTTKQDHLTNLSKAGFMQDTGGMNLNDRLNMNQGPSGPGKYAAKILPKAVGGMLALATAGAASPLAAAIAGVGTQAAFGGLSAKATGGDALKGALMGAGTSALGSAGGLLGGMAGQAAGGTGLTAGLAKNATTGLVTGFGGEGLGALVEGDDFSVKDALTSSAVGTAGGVAGDYVAGMFQDGGSLEGVGVGNPAGQTAPSSLEVGMSPGDYGNLNQISNQDLQMSLGRDLGYGVGAGLEGGEYRDTRTQFNDPTADPGEGDVINMSPQDTAANRAQNESLADLYQDSTYESTGGPGQIGGVGTGIGSSPQTTLSYNPMSELDMMGGQFEPAGGPGGIGGIGTGEGGTPLLTSDATMLPGLDAGQIVDDYEKTNSIASNFQKGVDPGVQERYMDYLQGTGSLVTPGATQESYGLGDVASLLGTIPGGLAAGGFGSGGGGSTGRQGGMMGLQDSTAGAEDPVSEQQVLKTGMHSVNPALLSQYMEFDNIPAEEKKKRQALWSGPAI